MLFLPVMAWKPSRTVALSLVVSLIALAVAVYGATILPAEAPSRPPQPSPSASRFLVLMPDGRVEMTGAHTHRVFRWDGRRWIELGSGSPPPGTPAR